LKVIAEFYSADSLPFYLTSLFSFSSIDLNGIRLLLCAVEGEGMPSPGQFQKYAQEIHTRTEEEVLFVVPGLSSWDRSRLNERRIGFIVPGRQIYVPALLLDLREHFQRERSKPSKFSYPSQVLVLLQVLKGTVEGKTVRQLSRELPYSATTMSRAVSEILALGLAQTEQGKTRPVYFLKDKTDLWVAALPFLQSPVKATLFAAQEFPLQELPYAGIRALSFLSMVSDEEQRCFAVSSDTVKRYLASGAFYSRQLEETDHQIQVWAYDPCLLVSAGSKTVDPLSLYLSLKEENDERVQKALKGLMYEVL